ncbi:alpha-hydroxy acid oxidase [Thiomicrorhabdus sp. zzn3]|uniref:alpha-hydroxy acid oxidase n=1 Tax=Thiomicrorhabdus sp. zzn3 TaxID=3039775 RepID=UPI0024362E25|nr:alpha-hydroxy acid oxidase [Thiomicrorhabdus sp. zzn3]MDG6778389.1 alpha-hydroxy acid oxidase [Thiomicrorhabdus sp. zzn3]
MKQIFQYHQLQKEILTPADFEFYAQKNLDPALYAYLSGGGGQQQTLKHNRKRLDQLQLQPRVLRKLDHGHSRYTLLGHELSAPILLAPVAHQGLVDEQAELASAQAAEAIGQGLVLSTLSTKRLESVAEATSGFKSFQLYTQPDRSVTYDLIDRACGAGFASLMVTVDTPLQSSSLEARRLGFHLESRVEAANLAEYAHPSTIQVTEGESYIFQGLMAQAPSWEDIRDIIEYSPIPVWIKGVLSVDDALMLKSVGAQGLVVSNHGGRALDGVPSPLDVLPSMRRALGADFLLMADSGVRSGYDIFKFLAAGADAVLIGRLQVYALATAGALGVAHLLKLLSEELQLCMALTGCAELDEIERHCLYESK